MGQSPCPTCMEDIMCADRFTERTHAYIAAKYYVHLTKAFEERGRKAFLHATQYYGMQRGRRMAQRAIRDGKELTQETYNYYGEWVATEEIRAEGIANRSECQPDGSLHIFSCPWYVQFRDMGLTEAGELYCSDLDSSISRGFNPGLGYVVEQTLYHADCCIHRLLHDDMNAGSGRGKNPEGLRSFEFHCAHLYWAYNEVTLAIFGEDGDKVNSQVLQDFEKDYGKEMADRIRGYQRVNFNVCEGFRIEHLP